MTLLMADEIDRLNYVLRDPTKCLVTLDLLMNLVLGMPPE